MAPTPPPPPRASAAVALRSWTKTTKGAASATDDGRLPTTNDGNNQDHHEEEGEENDEEEDDDEVEIIHVGSRVSPQRSDSASKKKARLTILDSDDEAPASRDGQQAVELPTTSPTPTRRQSLASRETPVAASSSISTSSSRRSSRLERQRQEKADRRSGPSPRKLEFRSLDNCLDNLSSGRTRGHEIEIDGDEDNDEEYEEEEAAPPPTRRAPARRETRRRVTDADDDLDEFIVGDDEVEYMDDDEEGVMRSGTDDDADVADEDHALDVRASLKSREPSEWFAIYLQYLEESILDEDLDNKMRRASHNTQYAVFQQAIHHIERAICSRRDSLRSNVDWGDEIMESLNFATKFVSQRCAPTAVCEACRRPNHTTSVVANFGGIASDGRNLYRENWMKKLRRSLKEQEAVSARYELGSVCHARLLGYWQFHRAKHFWVALVDAKRREHSDGRGRIADAAREAFYKQEFGRYKRLIGLAERFSEESHHANFYMPNVWKRVTSNHVQSMFLPSVRQGDHDRDSPRRGTLDSFVGESDDEEGNEDEGEEEEEEEVEEIEAVDENGEEETGVCRSSEREILEQNGAAK
ncbi:hypothetical protein PINS_up022975 [Pythium insidiosum]|nr:hypothetical protein PINS_up022975 [Pythium insidiosum]